MRMSQQSDNNSSSISREQVTTAYLNALKFIDKRVTPFLGKATTRVLVQAAAKRLADTYPCLGLLEKMPFSEVVPVVIGEQCHSSAEEVENGMNALLEECFKGLKELTGDLIEPPLHEEVTRQLGEIS